MIQHTSGTCLALFRVNRRCRSVLCETIRRYYSLRLLHIFLILPVITGCTGWYSFLLVLSMEFHTVSAYIPIPTWCTACYTADCETSGWSYAPYLFLYGCSGCLSQPHSDIFFSTVFCKPSGHFVKVILHCILLFPVKSLSMFR